MREFVLLDSGPLGHACRRRGTRLGDQCRRWLDDLLARGVDIIVPEVADYEVRRELTRIGASGSLLRGTGETCGECWRDREKSEPLALSFAGSSVLNP